MNVNAGSIARRATCLLCICGLAITGGCAATLTPDSETPTAPAAVDPAPPPSAPAHPNAATKPVTLEGLTFQMESLSASVQLYTHNRKGRPQTRRDISINGNVQDKLGRRLYRIADVDLESLTDGAGHSLLDGAEVNENASGYNDPWESIRMNRSPGSGTSHSFNIQVSGLDTLPARLGVLRGHVDVELVTDLMSIDIVPEESGKFVEAAPGISYRVSIFQFESTTLRYLIEYRLARPADAPARTPVFMGLDVRDPRGQAVYTNVRPLETVLGDTVEGVIQGELGLGRASLGPVRLQFVTGVKPLRFDFELADVALAEGARVR